MRSRYLFAVLVGVSLAAACGGSPSSPSSSSTNSNLAAQTVVMSAMAQAMSQITVVSPSGDNTFTMPCPGGGTIVTTFSMAPPSQGNVYRSTSRTEFRDCKNQTVTLNGDPYLETTAEHSFSSTGGPVGDSTSTLTMTGGMRMDGNGVRGRAQFNCTTIASVHVVNGAPQFSFTSSGTITFEQPIGSTPVTRPCGPS
jgi:hypothetical protein